MKRVGDFRILEPRDADFWIDESFSAALGIREGATLYGVSLVHRVEEELEPESTEVEKRLMTLIVTPFPRASWPRLIRMSVTLDPQPGSLFELVAALNKLHLFPRYVEDVTGTVLSGAPINRSATVAMSEEVSEGRSLLPSVTFVLELPSIETMNGENSPELYGKLAEVIKNPRASASVIPRLQESLMRMCKRQITIQWISPMATLNKLSKEPVKVEKIRVVRSPSDRRRLQVSLLPWRRSLWRYDSTLPSDELMVDQAMRVLAMASLDSDEKIIAWYFYQYDKRLVVQFSVTTPTYGLEHLWWEYIYDCVQQAKGSVLGSYSSARIDGTWGTLHCTAMFPLGNSNEEKELENVKRIVYCFRKLQGNRSSTKEFELFTQRLEHDRDEIGQLVLTEEPAKKRWRERSLNFLSQLDRLVVWDPFAGAGTPRFSNIFDQNPFSFTLPLRLESYRQLYGDLDSADKERTRRRLAGSIVDRLSQTPGENIALVGAHRAGKTTVLNLVYDLLAQRLREEKEDKVRLIPVRLYAPITPPHMLFVAILDEVKRLAKEMAETQEGVPVPVRSQLRTSLEKFSYLAMAALHGTEINILGMLTIKPGEFMEKLRGVDADEAKSLPAKLKENSAEYLPEFLKASLTALKGALDEKEMGGNFRLVVMMDEFSDSSMLGDSRTLSVWRHAIESNEFTRIKWLFSTTRPVKDAAEYSPITNILYEINVGSLRPEESERMIDAFSVTAWADELAAGGNSKKVMRPVITHPARKFLIIATSSLPYLLQVCCYHIYDRAIRTDFPLINKALCRRVILAKVLPEIADYLERQWSQVPDTAQHVIIESLESLPKELRTPEEFLEKFHQWAVDISRMPPGSLKALDRSGLRGEDGRCIAPLVAVWLLSNIR